MAESVDIRELNILIEQQSSFVTNLVTGMNRVIVGQRHLIDSLIISLLSDGHILLEGVPGLAKTLAIKTLAQLVDADYSRIQFTPDLLPADVVGTMIYSQKDEKFQVKKGPVFANFVLTDEINRAPAKVQSALLEAMQEHQVTIGETTFKLPNPFLVMATQNPIEQEGTYELPEAQVDRFMLKTIVDYPTVEEEKLIIRENLQGVMPTVTPVTSADAIMKAREVVNQVYIDEKIEQYIADIVFSSRYPERYKLTELKGLITYGGSPRASINLAKAARAYAFIKHRGYVVPEDVRAVAHDVMRHRIGLSYEAEAANVTSEEIVSKIINQVEVPYTKGALMETSDILSKVRKIEIKTKGLSRNIFAGQYHSAFKGRGMEFSEVREYQYGDDVRDIDWNVTARFHRPYVKVFEEERELTVMLLIDVSGSLNFGTSTQLKRDLVTEIAATLAFSAIQNNDKIGVIFFSDRIEKYIPPKKGRKHILYIIRELLDFQPESRRTDIAMATAYLTRIMKRRCTSFIISDFYDRKDFLLEMEIANRKHDVVAIQVYDQRAKELPNVGLMNVLDAETGHEMLIDTSSKKLRRAHTAYWLNREEDLRRTFSKSRVDWTSVATNEDFTKALLTLFKQRS